MSDLKEQRICIRFCVKLGKTGTETITMMQQAFGENVMTQSKIFEWHKSFREGRISVEDDSCLGQSSNSMTEKKQCEVRELIRSNHRLTVREIAEGLISFSSCQNISQNLEHHRSISKFVPRILTLKRKEGGRRTHTEIPKSLFEGTKPNDDFLKIFMTDNKTWVVTKLDKTPLKIREQDLKLFQKKCLRKPCRSKECFRIVCTLHKLYKSGHVAQNNIPTKSEIQEHLGISLSQAFFYYSHQEVTKLLNALSSVSQHSYCVLQDEYLKTNKIQKWREKQENLKLYTHQDILALGENMLKKYQIEIETMIQNRLKDEYVNKCHMLEAEKRFTIRRNMEEIHAKYEDYFMFAQQELKK